MCDSCAGIFPTERVLKYHQKRKHRLDEKLSRSSSTPMPKRCDLCKKEFKHDSSRSRHMASAHAGSDVSFQCEACNKKFNSRYKLSQHKLCHNNLTHKCVCGKTFRWKSSLCKHKQKNCVMNK